MVECSFTNYAVLGSSPVTVTKTFAIPSSKEFLDIQANIECGFNLKRVHDTKRRYCQIYRTDKYSEHTYIIWPVWRIGWVFVYELNGLLFESSRSHLIFRFRACFKQGVPWDSGNYRVWIYSERRTWHDKNIQAYSPYRYVLRTQLNHLAKLAKLASGSGSECSCSHLIFRFRACFEQEVVWHSGNNRLWIYSETCTLHDKNIQSNPQYR